MEQIDESQPVKTLHLMRHAKSSWDQPGLSDRERGLNKRGKRDAPRMGEALAGRIAPMSIAVSPARRAQLTLDGVCASWSKLGDIQHYIQEDLYTFSSDDLLQWIAAQDDGHGALFIIGHNPALTDLVNTLLGEYALGNLPTAGYVQMSLRIDRWCELRQGCGTIVYSLFPKELSH